MSLFVDGLILPEEFVMKRSQFALALLVIVGVTSTVSAQGERGRGFGRGLNSSFLLRNEGVQKELKLTEEQSKTLQEKLRAARGSREDFNNLSQEERQKRFTEMAKKTDEAINSVLDEKQKKRLDELQLQMAGPAALVIGEVAEKLNLDQEQKEKLRKIQSDNRSTQRFDFRNASSEERQK
ncbi:MAG: hypothetical protein KDA84_03545, partial [Planctomycetaceae bacterium]|nr:hypothetical protein [Planctomycetaceae bacterium]